jgi:hypothetical protein
VCAGGDFPVFQLTDHITMDRWVSAGWGADTASRIVAD